MIENRSMPGAVVIPVLVYSDVRAAVEWLCRAFGFCERLRIADHRSQLEFESGTVVVTGGGAGSVEGSPSVVAMLDSHSIMLRVIDVDRHYLRAKAAGARILALPTDQFYGERQYTALDPGGHVWTFSQSLGDVDPGEWGGVSFE